MLGKVRNVIHTFEVNGKSVEVTLIAGYNDGYYWDEHYMFDYNGHTYSAYDVGSGSGYTPCARACYRDEDPLEDRLYGWASGMDRCELDYAEQQIEEFISWIGDKDRVEWSEDDDDNDNDETENED